MKFFLKHRHRLAIVFVLVFLIIFLTHFQNKFNADEGVVLDGAWNLYNQRSLYIDFFEFIPPGSFYFIFFIWKIFGVSFHAASVVSVLIASGTALLLYLCAQNIRKSNWNLLIPLLFAAYVSGVWIINHNIYNLFFALWSVYLIMLAMDRKRPVYYLLGGILTGAATMFLQQKGLALGTAIFLFLLADNIKDWRRLLVYCSGALLPLLLLGLWPLKLVYLDLVAFPLFNYIEVNKISPVLFYFAILVVAASALAAAKEKDKKTWLVVSVSLFFVLSSYPLPDAYHIILSISPLFIFLGLIMSRPNKQAKASLRLAVYFPALVIVLLALGNFFVHAPFFGEPSYSWLDSLKKCPGQYIYAGPFVPNIYFEAGKLNVTPYPFLVTNHNTPSQFQEAKEYLTRLKPGCAVLIYPPSMTRFRHDKDNIVEAWVRENYNLVYSDAAVELYNLR